MEDLGRKIEEYADELFEDLGLSGLSEDKKADLFARVEDYLYKVILDRVRGKLPAGKAEALASALQQQDYKAAADLMKLSSENITLLNNVIDQEMSKLKQIIEKEQKYERQNQRESRE